MSAPDAGSEGAPVIGRLAPTPSGALHLGNAVAFAAAWLSVRSQGGTLLLRIEDVDTTRARAHLTDQIRRDLDWLGLDWDREVPPQSLRDYGPALRQIAQHTYRCQCTRREIRASGGIYLGTCREAGHTQGAVRFRLQPGSVQFVDRRWGARAHTPSDFGDPVLVRRDGITSYNLAVVADDITDGVTEVVRGSDLLDYTAVQMQLWRALGGSPPTWLHAPLILGPDGKKLSKSHGSLELQALRDAGRSPQDVWRVVLPWLGLPHEHVHHAIDAYRPVAGPRGPIQLTDADLAGLTA